MTQKLLSLLTSELSEAEQAACHASKAVKESKLAVSVAENKLFLETNGNSQLNKEALLRLKKTRDEKVSTYIKCLKEESDAQKAVARAQDIIETSICTYPQAYN